MTTPNAIESQAHSNIKHVGNVVCMGIYGKPLRAFDRQTSVNVHDWVVPRLNGIFTHMARQLRPVKRT